MDATWQDVRSWVLERNPDLSDLDPETDIIESRIVDSLQFVELVLFIEELRGQMLSSGDVDLSAFRTLRDIEKNFLLQ
ncbi:acyl carrier protein [Streptomyces alkaliterrae]|uniref:Acyl carrier protein n=1 Tax=Streptomyces alkaliterrae TaxID=2213162 RepID=A0A5P0YRR5_9ACTN|nr:acyl carrier protein [Streptomyces alkaliterrae]MBB1253317.1 acyl carrier protein [Streptomyces alkaliterrae]MBB1259278.1 acyl carrier protein [Streptomyces alkaliterrae]MQS02297.1 acyl carrier protein [Streptomyces alkaliterrae]